MSQKMFFAFYVYLYNVFENWVTIKEIKFDKKKSPLLRDLRVIWTILQGDQRSTK